MVRSEHQSVVNPSGLVGIYFQFGSFSSLLFVMLPHPQLLDLIEREVVAEAGRLMDVLDFDTGVHAA